MQNSRYEKLKKRMAENNLDIVIALSPENSYYYMQTYIVTQSTLRDRIALGIFSLESDPVMIACSVEKNTVEKETWIQDKRYYTEFQQSPMDVLVAVLIEKDFENKTIGIELDYLSTRYYRQLLDALPNAKFISCTRVLNLVRMVKEHEEIEKIGKAAFNTRIAIENAINETCVGDTERMLDIRIKNNMLALGAQGFTFYCMGTGEKSLQVHAQPDETCFVDGEMMRLDYGALYDLYNADLARTVIIGKPNTEYVDTFKRLCEVYSLVISHMKAGVTSRELYNICASKCKALNLPFSMPHIGHSLGIDLHEEPMLSPVENVILEENMVLNVEPLIIFNHRAYHIEDTILIKKDGHEILSQPEFDPHILLIK